MRAACLISCVCLAAISSAAQPVGSPYNNVKLSEKHVQSIEKLKTPAQKLKRYHKYYSKDSIKLVRSIDHYWKSKSDSLNKVARAKRQVLTDKKNDLVKGISDPVARLRVSGLITEDMYRLPAEVEINHGARELRGFYISFKNYLIECAKDTTNTLHMKMPAALSAKTTRARAFVGVPVDVVGDPAKLGQSLVKVPCCGNTNNGINGVRGTVDEYASVINSRMNNVKGQVSGAVKDKIGDNAVVAQGLELKGEAGKYVGKFKEYESYGNMSPDSLKSMAFARTEREIQQKVLEHADLSELGANMAHLDQMKAMGQQYNQQMSALMDSSKRREVIKQKAQEAALTYLEKNPQILDAAQKKMSLLMNKYSFVANSNDLSTAVKRTSLSGRPVRERLLFAANFQLLSIEPISIDFSPVIGYRFNSKFSLGGGGTYRQSFTDSIPTFSPDVWGYKAFASYDLLKTFFAYVEYDRNSPGVEVVEGITKRIWKPAAFVGVGRRFSVHKKVDMTAVAMYNFLWKPGDLVFPRPFTIRFGFQLSEVALLKRRPEVKL